PFITNDRRLRPGSLLHGAGAYTSSLDPPFGHLRPRRRFVRRLRQSRRRPASGWGTRRRWWQLSRQADPCPEQARWNQEDHEDEYAERLTANVMLRKGLEKEGKATEDLTAEFASVTWSSRDSARGDGRRSANSKLREPSTYSTTP